MRKWKRGLAALLTALLLTSLLPATALAEETEGEMELDSQSVEAVAEESNPQAETDPADVELSEIGVWVGDDYIRAEEGPSLWSLLPLEEKRYTLDLSGYLPDELKAVSLDTIKTATPQSGSDGSISGNIAVWARWDYYDEDGNRVVENDDFTVLGEETTIDLSSSRDWSNICTLELIVGTADQLNPNNVRYIITVYTSGLSDLLKTSATDQDGQKINVVNSYYSDSVWGSYYNEATGKYDRVERSNVYRLTLDKDQWTEGDFYLSLSPATELDSALSAQVYLGCYESEEDLPTETEKEITSQIWNENGTAEGYLADYSSLKDAPDFTIVWSRAGEIVSVMPIVVYAYTSSDFVSWNYLYTADSTGTNYSNRVVETSSDYEYDEDRNIQWEIYTMAGTYPADGTYRLPAWVYHNSTQTDAYANYVSKAVVGYYKSFADAVDQTDIKDTLFGNGYVGTFDKGVIITVFDKNEKVMDYIAVKTVAPEVEEEELPPAPTPLSADTYFEMRGAAKSANGEAYNAYYMPYEHDSYYYNGYQTVFLLDGTSPVPDETLIYPDYYTRSSKVTVFAGAHSDVGGTVSGSKQEDTGTAHTFQNGVPIQYSAAAENGTNLKNYWVTFLTQQSEPTLFVNGVTNAAEDHRDEDGTPIREVILDEAHDYHHDIFIANLGATEMNDLTVTLSDDAKNIKLDEYWTVNGTGTLGAFTTTNTTTSYGELSNVAKIRLLPVTDEKGNVVSGEISGTLTITGGGKTVTIKLTGQSGRFTISTDQLQEGVKYVHYSSVIQTSNMYESDAVTFTLVEGTLPSGLVLRPNGEIYGVPNVASTWTIKVQAAYTDADGQEYTDEKEYTLTIADNTDENVWNETDQNYELEQAIVSEDGAVSGSNDPTLGLGNSWESETQLFWTKGAYNDFVEVRLDGQKLTLDRDYTYAEGSTKITIQNQTLRSRGNGTHTISVEFREGGENGILKRAAQNYTITTLGTTQSGGSSGGSSNGSSGSRPSSKPTVTTPPQTTTTTFADIPQTHTFYEDVEWAYDNGLMQGVTDGLFVPTSAISQATIVTVLARMADVDLNEYENDGSYDTIPVGMWYTSAAVWATQAGLLPNHTTFNSEGSISRGDMAIMLVKYLVSLGIDISVVEPETFADANLMSQEVNEAFQVLYQFGIFKGVGSLYMDPLGTTTRGQFAALIHRMSGLIGF